MTFCFKQIIPPKEWVPRKEKFDIEKCDLKINDPIEQVVNGNRGIYNCINVHKKAISVKEFYKKATSPKYKTPQMTDLEDVERKYWKNLTFVAPIYGADVPGSITDKDCKVQSLLKRPQNRMKHTSIFKKAISIISIKNFNMILSLRFGTFKSLDRFWTG